MPKIIVERTFLNNKNKKKEMLLEMLPDIGEIYFDDKPDYRKLITVVKSMPQKYSLPLMLYADGYKYHEIAVKLGLSIGTVKSHIHTCGCGSKKNCAKSGSVKVSLL